MTTAEQGGVDGFDLGGMLRRDPLVWARQVRAKEAPRQALRTPGRRRALRLTVVCEPASCTLAEVYDTPAGLVYVSTLRDPNVSLGPEGAELPGDRVEWFSEKSGREWQQPVTSVRHEPLTVVDMLVDPSCVRRHPERLPIGGCRHRRWGAVWNESDWPSLPQVQGWVRTASGRRRITY